MIPPLRLLAQTSAMMASRGLLYPMRATRASVRCFSTKTAEQHNLEIHRLSSFAYSQEEGGNPAGVAFCEDGMPPAEAMMQIAAEVGYSETAFLQSQGGSHWRVRYFAPETEVPFCGHATIALGAALGQKHGANTYGLELNSEKITVEAQQDEQGEWSATLRSPPTYTKEMPQDVSSRLLADFGLSADDLDPRLPMKYANGGSLHAVVGLKSRETLANCMDYNFENVKALMQQHDILTIDLVHAESESVFHARNAFAIGGVVEDPATGSAAAALTGYLRDIGRETPQNKIEIYQGFDMGVPSHLTVEYTNQQGEPVMVSGRTRPLQ